MQDGYSIYNSWRILYPSYINVVFRTVPRTVHDAFRCRRPRRGAGARGRRERHPRSAARRCAGRNVAPRRLWPAIASLGLSTIPRHMPQRALPLTETRLPYMAASHLASIAAPHAPWPHRLGEHTPSDQSAQFQTIRPYPFAHAHTKRPGRHNCPLPSDILTSSLMTPRCSVLPYVLPTTLERRVVSNAAMHVSRDRSRGELLRIVLQAVRVGHSVIFLAMLAPAMRGCAAPCTLAGNKRTTGPLLPSALGIVRHDKVALRIELSGQLHAPLELTIFQTESERACNTPHWDGLARLWIIHIAQADAAVLRCVPPHRGIIPCVTNDENINSQAHVLYSSVAA